MRSMSHFPAGVMTVTYLVRLTIRSERAAESLLLHYTKLVAAAHVKRYALIPQWG